MNDIANLRDAQREYHYVIVGAGSVGCLLAYLLSQQQTGAVALIEAGSSVESIRTIVPNYYPHTFGSSVDWGFKTTAQAGLAGRRISWPRGKIVGGCGAINAMIYMHAAAQDFQRWGWPLASLDAQLMELDELMRPQALATPHPWSFAFLESAAASGLAVQESWQRSRHNSSGLFQLLTRSGRRFHGGQLLSANTRALAAVQLLDQIHATRICFSGSRASGVEVLDTDGRKQIINATQEVILCAGVVGTPELLMNSGIGDAAELRRVRRECICDLPWVGKNLHDHLVYPIVLRTRRAEGLPRRHGPLSRREYRKTGTGALASNIAEAGAIVTLAAEPQSANRNFQIHFTPTHYLKYPRTKTEDCYFSLAVTDLHPGSRGRLQFVEHQGKLHPEIDPRYLSEPDDCSRFVEAIQWTRRLVQFPGLQTVADSEVFPGAKRDGFNSIAKSFATFAQSIYHPVGTCRMDHGDDRGPERAVVDSRFRVHGLDNLRIVDASVLPDLPSCNTNAATLLLAIRAAKSLIM